MSATRSALPLTRITPPARWPGLEIRDLVRFRELGYRLVRRDITVRYRQTLLGVVWVVLQPLLTAGVLTLVFSRVADVPAPAAVPYFLIAFWGSAAFTTFNQCLLKSSQSLVGNGALVSKVYFPRLLLPLSTTGSTALDTLVGSALGIVLALASGVPLTWRLLTLPVWLVLLLVLGLSVGMIFAPLLLKYRDVAYVLPVLAQLLLYVSPVGYALNAVPEDLTTAFLINPLAPLLEAVRWATLATPAPPLASLLYASVVTGASLLGAAFLFRRQERVFADVI